jgi:hypothetical protein
MHTTIASSLGVARMYMDATKVRKQIYTAFGIGVATALGLAHAVAFDCCDSKSPFRLGEGYADTPATCETLSHWAERAPKTDARVSMVIRGKLSDVGATEALAYLEMCDAKGLRVVCVTYKTNGMRMGDVVTFAGGYDRRSKEWVMLDPCLASP